MSDDEVAMSIHLAACRFVPGAATKRFARNMAFQAANPDTCKLPLTEKQAKYLRYSVIRFRRQIPGDVVALAHKVAQEEKP